MFQDYHFSSTGAVEDFLKNCELKLITVESFYEQQKINLPSTKIDEEVTEATVEEIIVKNVHLMRKVDSEGFKVCFNLGKCFNLLKTMNKNTWKAKAQNLSGYSARCVLFLCILILC